MTSGEEQAKLKKTFEEAYDGLMDLYSKYELSNPEKASFYERKGFKLLEEYKELFGVPMPERN